MINNQVRIETDFGNNLGNNEPLTISSTLFDVLAHYLHDKWAKGEKAINFSHRRVMGRQ